MLGEITLTIKNKKMVDWQWTPHYINTRDNDPDPHIQQLISEIRAPFLKGPAFKPHVNPINGAVLRTPIDTVVGYTKVPLHRSNFSDVESMPAVVEGSSHDFLADAFKVACNADVGVMRGFRYGTHVAPGPIKLEDIYHYIPIGPQIACGEISADDLRWAIEHSAKNVMSGWVENWGGGWLIAFSGITYKLDPGNEYGLRVSDLRINGERFDPPRMYTVAGYWFLEASNKINGMTAQHIRTLQDAYGGIVDATEVVAYYLQSLPDKTVDPVLNRVKLVSPLPKPIGPSREIQPLKGVPRPDY